MWTLPKALWMYGIMAANLLICIYLKIRLFHGDHFPMLASYEELQLIYFNVIRNPLERVISHYHYMNEKFIWNMVSKLISNQLIINRLYNLHNWNIIGRAELSREVNIEPNELDICAMSTLHRCLYIRKGQYYHHNYGTLITVHLKWSADRYSFKFLFRQTAMKHHSSVLYTL